MRALAVVVGLVPALAEGQGEQSRDAVLTALAMNACAVTEDETAALFGAQGFGGEFVRHELGEMVLDGTAFLERGYILRVKADHCPPTEPVPTPAQAFRRAIEERGCSIDDDEARSLGIEVSRMRPAVANWIESGAASLEGRTLTLTECP